MLLRGETTYPPYVVYNSSGLGDTRVDRAADYRSANATQYLYNWTLDLSPRSTAAPCLDFRYLLKRFTSQFGDHTGRCIKFSNENMSR